MLHSSNALRRPATGWHSGAFGLAATLDYGPWEDKRETARDILSRGSSILHAWEKPKKLGVQSRSTVEDRPTSSAGCPFPRLVTFDTAYADMGLVSLAHFYASVSSLWAKLSSWFHDPKNDRPTSCDQIKLCFGYISSLDQKQKKKVYILFPGKWSALPPGV